MLMYVYYIYTYICIHTYMHVFLRTVDTGVQSSQGCIRFHYPKYDDNVCSKLFQPQGRTTSELVVRRALGIYFQ